MRGTRRHDTDDFRGREQGSRDWRLLPLALGVWAASLATHAICSRSLTASDASHAEDTSTANTHTAATRMTASAPSGHAPVHLPREYATYTEVAADGAGWGTSAMPLSYAWMVVALVALLAVGMLAGWAVAQIRPVARRRVVCGLAVVVAAMLVSGLSTTAHALAEWHDPVAARIRDGPAQVSVEAHVISPILASTSRDFDCQTQARVRTLSADSVTQPSRAEVRLFAGQAACVRLRNGATVRLDGRLLAAEYGASPNWLQVEAEDAVREIKPPNALQSAVNRMQDAFFAITGRLDDQGQVLVPGLTLGVLGQDHYTPSAPTVNDVYASRLEDAFRRAGIMHLMAVSGAHFVLIVSLVRRLGRWLLLPAPVIALMAAGAQALLAVAMFPADSVLRALVMGMFSCLALAVGRRSQALHSLCWTVSGAIIIDPSLARSYGFALSSTAVLGITLLSGPLTAWFARLLPRPVASAVALTCAAQSLTLPIQVLMEPELPLLSIPANVLVAPFVGFATIAGLAGLACAWALPELAYACAQVASWGTRVMEYVALWLGGGEHAVIPCAGQAQGAFAIASLEAALGAGIWLVARWRAGGVASVTAMAPDRRGRTFAPSLRERVEAWWRETERLLSSDEVRLKSWHKQQRRGRQ